MCLNPHEINGSARCSKFQPILKKSSLTSSNNTNNNDQKNSVDNLCDNAVLLQTLSASFSTIQIREYPITLGENPGGAKGPPITLDWKHDEGKTIVISLEEYEQKRSPRRNKTELYMPEYLRRWRLLERGVSMKEIHKATKNAESTRRKRKKTSQRFNDSNYGSNDTFG